MKRKLKQNLEHGLKPVSKLENMENGNRNKMQILKDQLMRIIMTIIQMVPLENSIKIVWIKYSIGEEVVPEVNVKAVESKAD